MDPQIQKFDCQDISLLIGENGSIGRGSFGVVRVGFHEVLGVVAVKCISYNGRDSEKKKIMKRFIKEMKHLQAANYIENVVRLHGYVMWSGSAAIIMEYLPNGNLFELLVDKDIPIGALLRLRVCSEIAGALAYIHNLLEENKLIHGDLKAENVLLTDDLHCKLSDFGSSVLANCNGQCSLMMSYSNTNAPNFTTAYAAPELFQDRAKITSSIGTYSFSMILYLIMARKYPSSCNMMMIYVQKIISGQRPELDCDDNCKKVFQAKQSSTDIFKLLSDTMQLCWKQNASERPSMLQVKNTLNAEQAKHAPHQVHEEVALATSNMVIEKPLQQDHQCETIDNFFPPLYDRSAVAGTSMAIVEKQPNSFPDIASRESFSSNVNYDSSEQLLGHENTPLPSNRNCFFSSSVASSRTTLPEVPSSLLLPPTAAFLNAYRSRSKTKKIVRKNLSFTSVESSNNPLVATDNTNAHYNRTASLPFIAESTSRSVTIERKIPFSLGKNSKISYHRAKRGAQNQLLSDDDGVDDIDSLDAQCSLGSNSLGLPGNISVGMSRNVSNFSWIEDHSDSSQVSYDNNSELSFCEILLNFGSGLCQLISEAMDHLADCCKYDQADFSCDGANTIRI